MKYGQLDKRIAMTHLGREAYENVLGAWPYHTLGATSVNKLNTTSALLPRNLQGRFLSFAACLLFSRMSINDPENWN